MLSFRFKGGVLLGGGEGVRRVMSNRYNQRDVDSDVGVSILLVRVAIYT